MYLASIFQEVLGWKKGAFTDFLYDVNIFSVVKESKSSLCNIFSLLDSVVLENCSKSILFLVCIMLYSIG